ncbi:hypothetical protein KFK09_019796 [Dendrobium nobile]|uniref:Uncharacterized protein n=1 Tax=Dendrobium nobile TaxID=94219 RepID=A0A8T3AS47_DENNO|nr:hypothetical protein KFK09_019796 [Dendrobium nobile]
MTLRVGEQRCTIFVSSPTHNAMALGVEVSQHFTSSSPSLKRYNAQAYNVLHSFLQDDDTESSMLDLLLTSSNNTLKNNLE